MDKNVSKKITVYNFVFTLFIVIYHWKNFYELIGVKSASYKYLYNFSDMLGTIAMSCFFAISGFLLYYSAKNTADVFKKLKRRVFSLFVPMMLWNTLAFIFQFVFAKVGHNEFEISLMKIVNGYTFAMFDGPLWYLLAMLMLMCAAPLVVKLRGKKLPGIIVLVAVSAVSIVLRTLLKGNESLLASWFEIFFCYVPTYSLGAFFALNFEDMVAKAQYKQKTAVFIAMPLLALIIAYNLIGINQTAIYLLIVIFVPIVCWLAVPSGCFEKLKIPFLFKTSFFIYALHYGFIIPVFNAIAIRFLSSRAISMPVACVIHLALFLLLVAVAYVFALVSKKILPKGIYNALSGGRG